ncbi:Lateral organ boundaries domain containing protein [Abeliophyllum distichum]|uniref:Lateral organ boundaries domain containing protein n=1 Tax=Abeliophyllum distichum TaxID=126358 RepID=A0ABD1TZ68_9LAMI
MEREPWNPISTCAACKYQRRKCKPNCLMAPFFQDKKEEFMNVHKLFGCRNIKKRLETLTTQLQKEQYVTSVVFEANTRARFPVGGCTTIIHQLVKDIIDSEAELSRVQQEINHNRLIQFLQNEMCNTTQVPNVPVPQYDQSHDIQRNEMYNSTQVPNVPLPPPPPSYEQPHDILGNAMYNSTQVPHLPVLLSSYNQRMTFKGMQYNSTQLQNVPVPPLPPYDQPHDIQGNGM